MTCPRYALKVLENATDGALRRATPALRRDCGEIMRRVSPAVAHVCGGSYLFGAALIAKVCDAFSYHVDVFSDTDRRLDRAFFLTAGFLALRRLVVFALLTHALPAAPPVFDSPDWLAGVFSTPDGEL